MEDWIQYSGDISRPPHGTNTNCFQDSKMELPLRAMNTTEQWIQQKTAE